MIYDFKGVVAVCITEKLQHLGSLIASMQSLFKYTKNLTYLLILNHENEDIFLEHKRLIEDSICDIGNNSLVIHKGNGGSVAREKMLQLGYIKQFEWYLNSDDDVLYNPSVIFSLHKAITTNPCNSNRYGFGFWDIKQREGAKNWFSQEFNVDDMEKLRKLYEVNDTPFHYWHNFQRWNLNDSNFKVIVYEDKPTAFANSYICKPSVFEPFLDKFLNWEKGVRGYDVYLHTYNQSESWPYIVSHVTHIGCFNGLINEDWNSHKPVSIDDKRDNLQKL